MGNKIPSVLLNRVSMSDLSYNHERLGLYGRADRGSLCPILTFFNSFRNEPDSRTLDEIAQMVLDGPGQLSIIEKP